MWLGDKETVPAEAVPAGRKATVLDAICSADHKVTALDAIRSAGCMTAAEPCACHTATPRAEVGRTATGTELSEAE
jgi:hypothetical protein